MLQSLQQRDPSALAFQIAVDSGRSNCHCQYEMPYALDQFRSLLPHSLLLREQRFQLV